MTDLFPDAREDVALARQIACVRREIGLRERVYPRRVADGKMRQEQADTELACMRAVLTTLTSLAEGSG
jgi:hypothetical protein